MKRCPECRRDYTDETLNFCLDDGAPLLDGPASMDEPATAFMDRTDPELSEAATRQQIGLTDETRIPSTVTAVNDARKKYLLAFAAVTVLILVGILGYRYLSSTADH